MSYIKAILNIDKSHTSMLEFVTFADTIHQYKRNYTFIEHAYEWYKYMMNQSNIEVSLSYETENEYSEDSDEDVSGDNLYSVTMKASYKRSGVNVKTTFTIYNDRTLMYIRYDNTGVSCNINNIDKLDFENVMCALFVINDSKKTIGKYIDSMVLNLSDHGLLVY